MKLRNCISKLHLDINISIKLNEMLIDALWFFFSPSLAVWSVFLRNYFWPEAVKQGRNKVYEIRDQRLRGGIRDHSPGIWDHNTWDRDQQCFCGIRDQNCERFWDQGSKFPMFLWSGIKILNVFVIRDQNLGQKYRISNEKKYLVTTLTIFIILSTT